jgi:DNA-binding LacI/PurR family transcriptional regulator
VKEVTQSAAELQGATIYQVAAQAGVSVATVSRMINASGYVGTRSRERIATAMRALHYEPNSLARSLTTKQTEMLALLLTDITDPFSAQIARGVQDVAREVGYIPIICSIDDDPQIEIETVRSLRRKRVDGIILTSLTQTHGGSSAEHLRVLHALCEQGLAMVCIGRPPVHPRADVVTTDTGIGARDAVAHLAALGHRRIGFIGGQIGLGVALGRLTGYREGLATAGLAADVRLVREGYLDEDSGRREARALLALPDPPTAIFCVNDRTAFGVLAALDELELAVPEDVSVVGFDDVPLAGLVHPALTTVRQPAQEIGRQAATYLLERIVHPDTPHQRSVLPCKLVVRRSSGPVPAAAPRILGGA